MAIEKIREKLQQFSHPEKIAFLKNYMKSSPVAVMALEGIEVVEAVRLLVGPTKSRIADAGSIRGDYSMSGQTNIIHASDSSDNALAEIKRFFKDDELFDYKKIDFEFLYGDEERGDLI